MADRLIKTNISRYQLLPYLLNEARREREITRYYPFDRKVFGSIHSTMATRLGLEWESSEQKESFLTALNHPKIDDGKIENFFSFRQIGERLTQFLVSEFIHFTYPRITVRDAKQLNQLYCAPDTIQKISKAYGITSYYECMQDAKEEIIDSTYAILGLMNQQRGLKATREFLDANLFKIEMVDALRDGRNPSVMLNILMKRYNQPLVEHRMVAESGRNDTESSVFVVNAYSGMNLLGQGMGCTLHYAKKNANQVAWQNLTLKKDPNPIFPSVSQNQPWSKSFGLFLP